MTHGNGKAAGPFEAGGPLTADGNMIWQVRLAPKHPGAPPGEWVPVFFTINSQRRGLPPEKRSSLMLTAADASKFGAMPGPNAVRTVEILGNGGDVFALATFGGIAPLPGMSLLAVDTLIGTFHIDGPSGLWSWTVKR